MRLSLDETMQVAIERHRAGRLAEAELLYRQVLAQAPDHFEALHFLGILAGQVGRLELAVELMKRAVTLNSRDGELQLNLGSALENTGRENEALAAYQAAVEIRPEWAPARVRLGNLYSKQGRMDDAIAAYRSAVQIDPRSAGAYCDLANCYASGGRTVEAIAAYEEAVRLEPSRAEAYNNLAGEFQKSGRTDAALAAYRRALEIEPARVEFLSNLGVLLGQMGRLEEAESVCREALQLKPEAAESHFHLGNVYLKSLQLDRAIAAYGEAVRLRKEFPDALNNLGCALAKKGEAGEAVSKFRAALRLKPKDAQTWMNLGSVLLDCGRLDEGLAAHREAIRIDPRHAEAQANLGRALLEAERLDEAEAVLQRAIELNPSLSSAQNNLGNCYKARGEIDRAIVKYRRAVELDPADSGIHSNLAFSLCYQGDWPAALAEASEWNRRHGRPLEKTIRPHGNDRTPDRKLRIGYVSPDFRDHVVAGCLRPLMRVHDRESFEIHCYSNVPRADAITEEFRRYADGWRNIVGVSDETAAELIRADGIDILVDLALHTSGNRLPLFARKPAPVQISWLGYCGTTGLEAMDYRLSDPYFDPLDVDLSGYSERTIRLPNCYWCYEPAGPPPDLPLRGAAESGRFTFGCLNNFAKVSSAALDAWTEILRSTPATQFLLHAPEGSCRRAICERMVRGGVDSDRLEFVGRQNWSGYMQSLRRIDLALDPFPYGGGISTCDALWMGAPVVSIAGQTPVGRGASSILSSLGLSELIAETPREYGEIASKLAGDRERLEALRTGMRERMENSSLRDARTYGRSVEAIYRRVWRDWCGGAND